MDKVTIEQVLENISKHLHLSKEAEYEVLAEIRTHLEDAVADAVKKGEDEQVALLKAAQKFGADEVGAELQEVHVGWESIDAIMLSALPVLFAIILRWLAFAPDGSALGWQ
ncbi:MAG TPA: permease prefix domain 1-containing protein, partial [Anaerolineae bacterium]